MDERLVVVRRRARGWAARARRVHVLDLLWRAWAEYSDAQGSIYAAAVTYYALLSLFPFLLFLVAVFGLVVRDQDLQAQAASLIVRQIPEGVELREQIEKAVSGVAGGGNNLALTLVSLLATAWTASGVFGALRRALNSAFDVPTARSFLRGRARDLAAVVSVTLLIFLSAALTTVLGIFRLRSEGLFGGALANLAWGALYLLLPLALSFVVFLLLYRFVPNITLGVDDLWIGALITAVGFELAKFGFGLYLANFGRYDEVYGTLGGAIAFLFFIFLMANLLIFAAELNGEIAKDRQAAREAASD